MRKTITILLASVVSLLTFAQAETIELTFDQFYDDPIYYEGAGDWVITVRDQEGNQFVFDFYGSPDGCEGTYSSTDGKIDFMFSTGTYQGTRVKYSTCELTITSTKPTASSTVYQLEANILSTEGVNFVIHATHKMLTPTETVEGAITDAQVTLNDRGFVLDAKSTDLELDIHLAIKSAEGVQGYYNNYFIDSINTIITHRGQSFIPAELYADIEFTSALSSDQAGYTIQMSFLTDQTVLMQLEVEAPIIPIDTVEIVCNNLAFNTSQASESTILFEASCATDTIYGIYSDTKLIPTTYEDGEVSVTVKEAATSKEVSMLQTSMTILGGALRGYTAAIEALGNNHKMYDIYLTQKGDDTPSAVDNVTSTVAPVKVIENGNLIIIKNGVKFNATGAVVK